MAGQSTITTNHDEIREWVEKRDGKPAVVKDTKGKGEGIGMLRINFPGYAGRDSLEEISWDEFFETFEKTKLAFLYQNELKSGKPSRFFKFVARR